MRLRGDPPHRFDDIQALEREYLSIASDRARRERDREEALTRHRRVKDGRSSGVAPGDDNLLTSTDAGFLGEGHGARCLLGIRGAAGGPG